MPPIPIIAPKYNAAQLVKATLIAHNQEAKSIELMFNPTDISFTRNVVWEAAKVSGDGLLPKINFSNVTPYQLTLKQLLFDTYETKKSVMTEYINTIKAGVTTKKGEGNRPPVYIFTWGETEYFYCVITALTYTLTMFLSDGTPVRAMVDISLQEVETGKNLPGGKEATPQGENRKQPIPGDPN